MKRERERERVCIYRESENRRRGMEVEVEVADLVKLGDVRTLDLMADLMDDRDVLLTNLLQAEAIIELLNRMEMMM